MLKNYLKVAIRTLFKNKLHSRINIVGLGVAIAVCILGYVNYRFSESYDKFHVNGDSIFAVHCMRLINGSESFWSENPIPLAPSIKNNIPGVEAFTRIETESGTLRHEDKIFGEEFWFVDHSFLSMLSYKLLEGATDALTDPYSIVISKEVAERFFGDSD
jgi:hypothetical protein